DAADLAGSVAGNGARGSTIPVAAGGDPDEESVAAAPRVRGVELADADCRQRGPGAGFVLWMGPSDQSGVVAADAIAGFALRGRNDVDLRIAPQRAHPDHAAPGARDNPH